MIPEIGASLDLEVRRTKLADAEQYKKACQQFKIKKKKNV